MPIAEKIKIQYATPEWEHAELPALFLDWIDRFGSLEFSARGVVYKIIKTNDKTIPSNI